MNTAETECLKINCSCEMVSSTMEYLSKERTCPESLAPFNKWTVVCFPLASARLRNDSWMLMTDINFRKCRYHPTASAPAGLWAINDLPKIEVIHPSVQYIIG